MVLVDPSCLISFPLLQLVLLFTCTVLLTCRAHQAQHVCQPCVDAVLLLDWVHLIVHGLAWLFTLWEKFPWTPLPKWPPSLFLSMYFGESLLSLSTGHTLVIHLHSLICLCHESACSVRVGTDFSVHWCSLYLGREHIVGSPKYLLNKSFLCKMLLYRSLYSINYWEPIHRRNIVTCINLTFLFPVAQRKSNFSPCGPQDTCIFAHQACGWRFIPTTHASSWQVAKLNQM